MFKKPFRTKSNCQLKTSEKKKLLSRIKESLPQIKEDDELFNIKDSMNVVKVVTYSGTTVNIFVHGVTPAFIEVQDVIYPTIFTLWNFPNLVYSFVTHNAVIGKLCNGADLMLPGVIFSSDFSSDVDMIVNGRPVAVCTNANFASIAVGQCVISGRDISNGVKVGRAVKILHTFGDELEKLLDTVPKIPMIPHSAKQSPGDSSSIHDSSSGEKSNDTLSGDNICEAVEGLNLHRVSKFEQTYSDEDTITSSLLSSASGCEEEHANGSNGFSTEKSTIETSDDVAEDDVNMDDLANYCLLKGLLTKKLELPVLTNVFYSKIMLSCVPEGYELNIKKTKYKKLSNMLKDMAAEGVLVVEDNKGVQSITNVNPSHPIFKDISCKYGVFNSLLASAPTTQEEASALEKPEEIKENLVINKLVSPLFNDTPFQKGDSLTVAQAREIIVKYVNANGLNQPYAQNVVLDPLLSDIIGTRQPVMPWSDLMNRIIDKMPSCYTIRTSRDRIISGKGKLPLIYISTATRSGNKSVTIVNNLGKYGINIDEFARHCQHALAASTTTQTTTSGVQFQVQGSHKSFICALLAERYNIPSRVIPGFVDKAKGKKESSRTKMVYLKK